MIELEREMAEVKKLGDRIGYGNMIECAKALWNEELPVEHFIVDPHYADAAKAVQKHL